MTDNTTMPDSIRAYREDRRLNQRGGVTVTTNHWLDSPVTLESRADDDPSTYAEYIRADLMGWVPVSERLPTEEDAIDGEIVVLSDVGLEVIRYEYIANKQNKWGITHWMPLPPLPGDSE